MTGGSWAADGCSTAAALAQSPALDFAAINAQACAVGLCIHTPHGQTGDSGCTYTAGDLPAGLKHVVISAKWPPSAFALACIAALPNLKTLQLKCATDQPMPDLDFAASPCLQAVCLINLVPRKVLLPPATRFTVEAEIRLDRYSYGLIEGFPCHGVHLSSSSSIYLIATSLNRLLGTNCSGLTSLSLTQSYTPGMSNSDGEIFLGRSVSQLRFLSVDSEGDLNIRLALPFLSGLSLSAHGNLELEFYGLDAVGARLESLYLSWVTSRTMPAVADVLKAVCQPNIMAGRIFCESWFKYIGVKCPRLGRPKPISHCDVESGACGACINPDSFGIRAPTADPH